MSHLKTLVGFVFMDDTIGFCYPIYKDNNENFFYHKLLSNSYKIKEFEARDTPVGHPYYSVLPIEFQTEYAIGDNGAMVCYNAPKQVLIIAEPASISAFDKVELFALEHNRQYLAIESQNAKQILANSTAPSSGRAVFLYKNLPCKEERKTYDIILSKGVITFLIPLLLSNVHGSCRLHKQQKKRK